MKLFLMTFPADYYGEELGIKNRKLYWLINRKLKLLIE